MPRLAAAVLGTFAVAVLATLAVSGPPTATAAPPVTDERGFVDSTARCAPPNKAIAFGYTASSRVAICRDDASGQYQYRGVRVSDGARLILAARSTDRGYVAENDGITYTVTSTALVISSGSEQIRSEPMVDFNGSAPSSSPSASSTPSGPTQPSAVPETVTPTTPLPPPLPAEAGHG
ncbi:MAG TPA: hypothetical protein VET27_17210 [Mycobacterium sp.]|nr:hypothetical protein [Mycobacterium sp.]